jgi:hypothetical protein
MNQTMNVRNDVNVKAIPFCIECQYYKRDWSGIIFSWGHKFGKCARPKTGAEPVEVDLVSGKVKKKKITNPHAEIERKFDLKDHCGPDAKYFTPKNSTGTLKLLQREQF